MRLCALTTILLACETPAGTVVVPSLHGVLVIAGSDHPSPEVVDRLGTWTDSDPDCVGDEYGGMVLVADVAPQAGDETVLASFSQGVVVLDAAGHRIASAPGFDCMGSQDELIGIEIVRSSFDAPVIAVAVAQGGRRESTTSIELFALDGSRLDRLFAGEIERHDDAGIHTGDVTVVPGGLIYMHPTEGTSVWRYDRATHRYVIGRVVDQRGDR